MDNKMVACMVTVDVAAFGLINQSSAWGIRRNSNFTTVQLVLLRHAISYGNDLFSSEPETSLIGSAADRERSSCRDLWSLIAFDSSL